MANKLNEKVVFAFEGTKYNKGDNSAVARIHSALGGGDDTFFAGVAADPEPEHPTPGGYTGIRRGAALVTGDGAEINANAAAEVFKSRYGNAKRVAVVAWSRGAARSAPPFMQQVNAHIREHDQKLEMYPVLFDPVWGEVSVLGIGREKVNFPPSVKKAMIFLAADEKREQFKALGPKFFGCDDEKSTEITFITLPGTHWQLVEKGNASFIVAYRLSEDFLKSCGFEMNAGNHSHTDKEVLSAYTELLYYSKPDRSLLEMICTEKRRSFLQDKDKIDNIDILDRQYFPIHGQAVLFKKLHPETYQYITENTGDRKSIEELEQILKQDKVEQDLQLWIKLIFSMDMLEESIMDLCMRNDNDTDMNEVAKLVDDLILALISESEGREENLDLKDWNLKLVQGIHKSEYLNQHLIRENKDGEDHYITIDDMAEKTFYLSENREVICKENGQIIGPFTILNSAQDINDGKLHEEIFKSIAARYPQARLLAKVNGMRQCFDFLKENPGSSAADQKELARLQNNYRSPSKSRLFAILKVILAACGVASYFLEQVQQKESDKQDRPKVAALLEKFSNSRLQAEQGHADDDDATPLRSRKAAISFG